MRRRDYLGSLELMVLLAVLRLGEDAYGVPISREIEDQSGRPVPVASIYAALLRLEEKDLVSCRLGNPTAERGGRAKKYFEVTEQGVREARQTQRALTRLWRGVRQLNGATV